MTVRRRVWAKLEHRDQPFVVGRSEPLRSLARQGILVPEGFDELAATRLRYARMRFGADGVEVVVTPTLACNLQCAYCFEGRAQERSRSPRMSRAVETHLVRWLAAQVRGRRRLTLTWYGGEPLLALGTIERVTASLRPALDAAGIAYRATIITNGTRITADVAKRLKTCHVASAQLTVDVPAGSRADAGGREALDRILDGALAACKAGINVHLRVNVLEDDQAAFDRLYGAIRRRGLAPRLKGLDFHLVRCPEAPRARPAAYRTLSLRRFERCTLRERRKAIAAGLPATTLSFSHHSLCMAVRDRTAVVGPDGRLYKCMEEVGLVERSHGSIVPGTMADDAKLVPWMSYDWFSHAQCRDCIVLPQCAGGCVHRRLFAPERLVPDDFCFAEIRANLEDRIRLFAEHGPRGRGAVAHEGCG